MLLLHRVEAAWSKLGKEEPYWSVLTDDTFRAETIDDATIEAFYASGAEEVEAFEAACVRNGLPNMRQATVLDLGCGIGRVGEHFARAYDGYIGVDISESHLRPRAPALRVPGPDQRASDGAERFSGRVAGIFDVFFSILSLQHSPPPVMQYLLQLCLERLQPGGYAFFQLPCYLYNYEFRLSRIPQSRLGRGGGDAGDGDARLAASPGIPDPGGGGAGRGRGAALPADRPDRLWNVFMALKAALSRGGCRTRCRRSDRDAPAAAG